jgi:DNA primase
MDVVALAQLGFPNAVATLGTACTNEHVQKLFRFTDSVVFSFDGDAAGRRAARKALDGALPFATDVRSIKFLFLPAEHDPDSFIRAHGQEAFANYVAQATPLSSFLLESARDGCDLTTAEGRAHATANAKPLWTQLPEGALKLQLLEELATMVQLSSDALGKLWAIPAAGAARHAPESRPRATADTIGYDDAPPNWDPVPTTSSAPSAPGKAWLPREEWLKQRAQQGGWEPGKGRSANRTPRPAGPLAKLDSRADHAARLLLHHSELWETLTGEDHGLLCDLPAPHGELFVWLESQLHEHGPVSRGTLRDAIVGHAAEDYALGLLGRTTVATEPSTESAAELRNVIDRMLIDHIKVLETEAIAASANDPSALARYRELQVRRKQLELAVAPKPTPI